MLRFCTECGERVDVSRWHLFIHGCSRCAKCKKTDFARLPALLFLVLSSCFLGFVVGKLSPTTSSCEHGRLRTLTSLRSSVRVEVGKQCAGKTRSGRRCKRKIEEGNYCWQHRR